MCLSTRHGSANLCHSQADPVEVDRHTWREQVCRLLILGALHIEFVIEAVEGKLVDGSGFSSVISEAGVLTSGCAEAVSSPTPDHHLKRMRYVHQVFFR